MLRRKCTKPGQRQALPAFQEYPASAAHDAYASPACCRRDVWFRGSAKITSLPPYLTVQVGKLGWPTGMVNRNMHARPEANAAACWWDVREHTLVVTTHPRAHT